MRGYGCRERKGRDGEGEEEAEEEEGRVGSGCSCGGEDDAAWCNAMRCAAMRRWMICMYVCMYVICVVGEETAETYVCRPERESWRGQVEARREGGEGGRYGQDAMGRSNAHGWPGLPSWLDGWMMGDNGDYMQACLRMIYAEREVLLMRRLRGL